MNTQNINGQLRVTADNTLFGHEPDRIQELFRQALDREPCHTMVLDLNQVQWVDSMGIRVIMMLLQTCMERKLSFKVDGKSPQLIKLMQICKLDQLFLRDGP